VVEVRVVVVGLTELKVDVMVVEVVRVLVVRVAED
jgi:hypothetical protein